MAAKPAKYIRLREKNQITLPSDLIEGLGVKIGGFFELVRTDDNSLQLRPTALVIMNSDLSKREEELALEDSAMEEAKAISNEDDFRKRLNIGKPRGKPGVKTPAVAQAQAAKTSGA
jgi:bifunctional DNA-binding transcriptional regulator/antitoxin component of YhaV-PrlF toxin-antitoxin module